MTEITGELREWREEKVFGVRVLIGKIYNDSKGRFEDGTVVRTSAVSKIADNVAYTRNSVYKLDSTATTSTT